MNHTLHLGGGITATITDRPHGFRYGRTLEALREARREEDAQLLADEREEARQERMARRGEYIDERRIP
jgi:hypothetical protein